jgi:hypothetical protein
MLVLESVFTGFLIFGHLVIFVSYLANKLWEIGCTQAPPDQKGNAT